MSTVVLILSLCVVAAVTAWIASTWLKSVIVNSVAPLKKENREPVSVSVEKLENRKLTLKDVEMCIRKEGYLPTSANDGFVEFRHEGDVVSVFYSENDGVFIMRKTFGLSPEQMEMTGVLENICSKVQDHLMYIRNYLHTFPENGALVVVFEIGFFIDSAEDFEKYFPNYIAVINDSVNCHRYFLDELTQGKCVGTEKKVVS